MAKAKAESRVSRPICLEKGHSSATKRQVQPLPGSTAMTEWHAESGVTLAFAGCAGMAEGYVEGIETVSDSRTHAECRLCEYL